jgi:hypothetical protein
MALRVISRNISAVLSKYSCTFKNITEQCAEEKEIQEKRIKKGFTMFTIYPTVMRPVVTMTTMI